MKIRCIVFLSTKAFRLLFFMAAKLIENLEHGRSKKDVYYITLHQEEGEGGRRGVRIMMLRMTGSNSERKRQRTH